MGRFTKSLDIFNARSKADWDILLSKLPQYADQEEVLKHHDWVNMVWDSNNTKTRDDVFQLCQMMGYHGVFNFESGVNVENDGASIGLFNGEGFGLLYEYHFDWDRKQWCAKHANGEHVKDTAFFTEKSPYVAPDGKIRKKSFISDIACTTGVGFDDYEED